MTGVIEISQLADSEVIKELYTNTVYGVCLVVTFIAAAGFVNRFQDRIRVSGSDFCNRESMLIFLVFMAAAYALYASGKLLMQYNYTELISLSQAFFLERKSWLFKESTSAGHMAQYLDFSSKHSVPAVMYPYSAYLLSLLHVVLGYRIENVLIYSVLIGIGNTCLLFKFTCHPERINVKNILCLVNAALLSAALLVYQDLNKLTYLIFVFLVMNECRDVQKDSGSSKKFLLACLLPMPLISYEGCIFAALFIGISALSGYKQIKELLKKPITYILAIITGISAYIHSALSREFTASEYKFPLPVHGIYIIALLFGAALAACIILKRYNLKNKSLYLQNYPSPGIVGLISASAVCLGYAFEPYSNWKSATFVILVFVPVVAAIFIRSASGRIVRQALNAGVLVGLIMVVVSGLPGAEPTTQTAKFIKNKPLLDLHKKENILFVTDYPDLFIANGNLTVSYEGFNRHPEIYITRLFKYFRLKQIIFVEGGESIESRKFSDKTSALIKRVLRMKSRKYIRTETPEQAESNLVLGEVWTFRQI